MHCCTEERGHGTASLGVTFALPGLAVARCWCADVGHHHVLHGYWGLSHILAAALAVRGPDTTLANPTTRRCQIYQMISCTLLAAFAVMLSAVGLSLPRN